MKYKVGDLVVDLYYSGENASDGGLLVEKISDIEENWVFTKPTNKEWDDVFSYRTAEFEKRYRKLTKLEQVLK